MGYIHKNFELSSNEVDFMLVQLEESETNKNTFTCMYLSDFAKKNCQIQSCISSEHESYIF